MATPMSDEEIPRPQKPVCHLARRDACTERAQQQSLMRGTEYLQMINDRIDDVH